MSVFFTLFVRQFSLPSRFTGLRAWLVRTNKPGLIHFHIWTGCTCKSHTKQDMSLRFL